MKRCAGIASTRSKRITAMQPEGGADTGWLGPAFQALESLVVSTTGHARLAAKNGPLLEKLERRLRTKGLSSFESYLDLVTSGAEGESELDSLIAELTVGETSFFRHPEQFDLLRDVALPDCLSRKAHTGPLRIWSAGCANGAEAYSIAILLQSLLGERGDNRQFSIVGTDINRAALAEAEAGLFSDWTLREMAEPRRRGFFRRTAGGWAIKDRYKRNVRFVHHNLISDEYPTIHKDIFAFDVVFCRNVMIYFDEPTNVRLAERLDSVLNEGGWLFVGPTDFNPGLQRVLQPESHPGRFVYRKRSPAARASVEPAAALLKPSPSVELHAEPIEPELPRRAPPHQTAPQPTDIDTIIDLANRGDWASAARLCQALLKRDGCNAEARYYHALVLQNTGCTREAERELKRAVYLDRDFALAHYQLGMARRGRRDLSGSRRAFRNVIDVLNGAPDDQPIGMRSHVTAGHLRNLAAQQLALMERP